MADPAYSPKSYQDVTLPDVSHLVTEDEEPVDNFYQDKQANLLCDALDASWPQGRPFVSAADVAIYATNQESPVVPDMLLSIGVSFPESVLEKEHRCYYMWQFGKPPEVVTEIVSNLAGREEDEKLERYARIKVPYYVVFDPHQLLGGRMLRIRQLSGASYVDKLDSWFPELDLGLCVWTGEYDGMTANWLRWCQRDGTVLKTGIELARHERERADSERERADFERERADAERKRADALEARLKALEG
jgi:Uma2 family endonuclease